MPADPPSNTGSPDRNRPPGADLSKESSTEADLWNLDDDPLDRPAPRPAVPPAQAKSAPEPAEGEAHKRQKRGMTPDHPEKRKPKLGKTEPQASAPADELGELEESYEDADEEEVLLVVLPEDEEELLPAAPEATAEAARDGSPPRQNRPRPEATATPVAAAGSFRFTRPSARELIGIAAVVFIMMLGGIWVLSRFFSQLSFQAEYVKPPSLPVKGQQATITALGTYWREPVREGPQADRAKREAVMIPVVELTLDPASTSGALRIVFRNETGTTTGDTLIRSFQGGRFTDSGEARIAIAASDGFSKEGDFNAYRTSDDPPWTVEVKEGPSSEGASTTFQPLLIAPILPLRR